MSVFCDCENTRFYEDKEPIEYKSNPYKASLFPCHFQSFLSVELFMATLVTCLTRNTFAVIQYVSWLFIPRIEMMNFENEIFHPTCVANLLDFFSFRAC